MDKFDVVAAIIIKDDKYFIAQRNRNKHMGLSWEFPGGKVEEGETFEIALKREIKEELGVKPISVKKLESLIIAPDILEEITDIYLAYVPRITNFKIINPNEGEYIKIIPMKKKQILEILKTNRTQNIVTKYSFLKIKELKI